MNTTQEIMNYINQKSHNGALLVTGKWGCGKTYLIRNIITEINKGEEYLGIGISLFGVDTIKELHKRVKEAVSKRFLLAKFLSISERYLRGRAFCRAR